MLNLRNLGWCLATVALVGCKGSGEDSKTEQKSEPESEHLNISCGALPTIANGKNCEISTGTDTTLLIKGNILASGGIIEGGSVLLDEDGVIQCVGCNCEKESMAAGATILICPDTAISPALINAHEHITWSRNAKPAFYTKERYEHRHEWRTGKNNHTSIPSGEGTSGDDMVAYGELRQLMGGTLSMAGSGKAVGYVRNLDKEEGTGSIGADVYYQTFPLGDNNGKMLDSDCGYAWKDDSSVATRECYLPHIAEGINEAAHNEFLCMSGNGQGSRSLVAANTAIVHAVGMAAPDGGKVVQEKSSIVWSPRSNISLYANTAPVTMYHNMGINVAMGTDWIISGSATMPREMACADYMNKKHFGSFFSARDIWRMATINGARALKVDDTLGVLRPGWVGDIAIYALNGGANMDNPDSYYQAIIDSTPDEVVLVLRSGEFIYGDSDIINNSGTLNCEDMGNVCGREKSVCNLGAKTNYSIFKGEDGAGDGAYKLYYCDNEWESEPPCVPYRNNLDKDGKPIEFKTVVSSYDGNVSADDSDGDGVPNVVDNCPTIFNPIRPMDNGRQADFDGDGLGDVCDPCPLNAQTNSCDKVDADDYDGDGIPNAEDNCPSLANADQADADNDRKGDICDACPYDPNPGLQLCPALETTIFDVQQGKVNLDTRVKLSGIVGAVSTFGQSFTIQTAPSFASKAAAANQGLYIYDTGKSMTNVIKGLSVGTTVTVTGELTDYYGEKEITTLETVEITGPEAELVPLELTTADLQAATVSPYEGILATVKNVTVRTAAADNSWLKIDDNIYVGNKLYHNETKYMVGTDFTSITGIVMFQKVADTKSSTNTLEPRSAADYQQNCSAGSQVVSITPAELTLKQGMSGELTFYLTCQDPGEAKNITVAYSAGCEGLLLDAVSDVQFTAGASTASLPFTTSRENIGTCEISYENLKAIINVREPTKNFSSSFDFVTGNNTTYSKSYEGHPAEDDEVDIQATGRAKLNNTSKDVTTDYSIDGAGIVIKTDDDGVSNITVSKIIGVNTVTLDLNPWDAEAIVTITTVGGTAPQTADITTGSAKTIMRDQTVQLGDPEATGFVITTNKKRVIIDNLRWD